MNTFLPFKDFAKSAKSLDNKRLGKQRVEVLQILNCLYGKSDGWKNHPAVKQWKNYEDWLVVYGNEICCEWISRGYKDTCKDKIMKFFNNDCKESNAPFWLGDDRLHRSHQSNLIRKFPEHYRPLFGNEIPNNIPYWWPVQ